MPKKEFDVYTKGSAARKIWDRIMEAAAPFGVSWSAGRQYSYVDSYGNLAAFRRRNRDQYVRGKGPEVIDAPSKRWRTEYDRIHNDADSFLHTMGREGNISGYLRFVQDNIYIHKPALESWADLSTLEQERQIRNHGGTTQGAMDAYEKERLRLDGKREALLALDVSEVEELESMLRLEATIYDWHDRIREAGKLARDRDPGLVESYFGGWTDEALEDLTAAHGPFYLLVNKIQWREAPSVSTNGEMGEPQPLLFDDVRLDGIRLGDVEHQPVVLPRQYPDDWYAEDIESSDEALIHGTGLQKRRTQEEWRHQAEVNEWARERIRDRWPTPPPAGSPRYIQWQAALEREAARYVDPIYRVQGHAAVDLDRLQRARPEIAGIFQRAEDAKVAYDQVVEQNRVANVPDPVLEKRAKEESDAADTALRLFFAYWGWTEGEGNSLGPTTARLWRDAGIKLPDDWYGRQQLLFLDWMKHQVANAYVQWLERMRLGLQPHNRVHYMRAIRDALNNQFHIPPTPHFPLDQFPLENGAVNERRWLHNVADQSSLLYITNDPDRAAHAGPNGRAIGIDLAPLRKILRGIYYDAEMKQWVVVVMSAKRLPPAWLFDAKTGLRLDDYSVQYEVSFRAGTVERDRNRGLLGLGASRKARVEEHPVVGYLCVPSNDARGHVDLRVYKWGRALALTQEWEGHYFQVTHIPSGSTVIGEASLNPYGSGRQPDPSTYPLVENMMKELEASAVNWWALDPEANKLKDLKDRDPVWDEAVNVVEEVKTRAIRRYNKPA